MSDVHNASEAQEPEAACVVEEESHASKEIPPAVEERTSPPPTNRSEKQKAVLEKARNKMTTKRLADKTAAEQKLLETQMELNRLYRQNEEFRTKLKDTTIVMTEREPIPKPPKRKHPKRDEYGSSDDEAAPVMEKQKKVKQKLTAPNAVNNSTFLMRSFGF